MKAVFIHVVNGTTKTATFTAPKITVQNIGRKKVHIELFAADGTTLLGAVNLTKTYVTLQDELAIEQYGPLSKPTIGQDESLSKLTIGQDESLSKPTTE